MTTDKPFFQYRNSLARMYDYKQPVAAAVRFSASRYGKYKTTLHFKEKKTEAQLIHAAERYLSQRVTKSFFELVKDDLFPSNEEQPKWQDYAIRGDLLGDCVYLESASVDTEGVLILTCGS